MEPKFEFTFSYWILTWFLLYWFGGTIYNPKIWLIIALFANIFGEIYRIIFTRWSRTWTDNILFIIVDLSIKVLPIWLLRNTPTKFVDFYAGIVLFILFASWLLFRLGSIEAIVKYEKDVQRRLTEKKAATPIIHLLHKWNVIQ
jgi:hypothetical protein